MLVDYGPIPRQLTIAWLGDPTFKREDFNKVLVVCQEDRSLKPVKYIIYIAAMAGVLMPGDGQVSPKASVNWLLIST